MVVHCLDSRLFRIVLALLFVTTLMGPLPRVVSVAQAANNLPISGFYGTYGTTTAAGGLPRYDLDRPRALNHRDIAVTIGRAENGFRLTTKTSFDAVSEDGSTESKERAETLTFQRVKSDVRGAIYYRGLETGDPFGDGAVTWAFVHQRTLVVNRFKVLPDGRHLLSAYGHTLDDGILELIHYVDYAGQSRQEARGELQEQR